MSACLQSRNPSGRSEREFIICRSSEHPHPSRLMLLFWQFGAAPTFLFLEHHSPEKKDSDYGVTRLDAIHQELVTNSHIESNV